MATAKADMTMQQIEMLYLVIGFAAGISAIVTYKLW